MDCVSVTVDAFRMVFGSEALVDVVEAEPDRVVARFYGNMCYTCGTVDYFEDFAYMYGECAGEEWAVESYQQNPDGTYTATLRPKRLLKTTKRHIKIIIDNRELDYYIET